MGEIDWSKLHDATSEENRPTPGYLFNEIIKDVSHADPRQVPAVARFLVDCVDGDHAHVKLKALFVIKSLAYRIPPFCKCMQEHIPSITEAASYTGPPSAMYGDEPYRLVREAAEGALAALSGSEHYHEKYAAMSQRIVGFGNYLPDPDTVLPDGSVNTTRDVRAGDVISSSLDYVVGGVGSMLVSVKDFVASSFSGKNPTFGEDGIGDIDAPEDLGEVDREGEGDDMEDEGIENTPGREDVEEYQPSSGTYVPPWVPPAPSTPEPEQDADPEPIASEDLMWFGDEGAAQSPDLLETGDVDEVLSEAAILQSLGINASGSANRGALVCQEEAATAAPLVSLEAEAPAILPGDAAFTPAATGMQATPKRAPRQLPVQQLPGGFMEV